MDSPHSKAVEHIGQVKSAFINPLQILPRPRTEFNYVVLLVVGNSAEAGYWNLGSEVENYWSSEQACAIKSLMKVTCIICQTS